MPEGTVLAGFESVACMRAVTERLVCGMTAAAQRAPDLGALLPRTIENLQAAAERNRSVLDA